MCQLPLDRRPDRRLRIFAAMCPLRSALTQVAPVCRPFLHVAAGVAAPGTVPTAMRGHHWHAAAGVIAEVDLTGAERMPAGAGALRGRWFGVNQERAARRPHRDQSQPPAHGAGWHAAGPIGLDCVVLGADPVTRLAHRPVRARRLPRLHPADRTYVLFLGFVWVVPADDRSQRRVRLANQDGQLGQPAAFVRRPCCDGARVVGRCSRSGDRNFSEVRDD